MSRIAVVGDALLDRDLDGRAGRLCPDAPAPVLDDVIARERPGGAGLAAALLARDGHDVTLVTALGSDAAGAAVRRLLEAEGVAVEDLGGRGATPEKVRVRAAGQVLVRLDREGAAPPVRPPGAAVRRTLADADAVLVSDYGRGVAGSPGVRAAVTARGAPTVWDPHPRGGDPAPGMRLVTPNAAEARLLAPDAPDDAARADRLRARLGADAVAVTRGADGAVHADAAGPPVAVPAPRVAAGDPCGAGDRLAAAAAAAIAAGRSTLQAVREGVAAASAFVAAGGAGAALGPRPAPAGSPALETARAVRASGGRVVATGGCFDLLHAGHVAMLEAARALGDCLIVLLNSDASVRRLKGPDRPLVEQGDRAAVLSALRCVDAVELFDEDTPAEALRRLRPHVFTKGGDYAADELPESRVVRDLGGEVVVLPYVEGRSTTRLITEVLDRVAR